MGLSGKTFSGILVTMLRTLLTVRACGTLFGLTLAVAVPFIVFFVVAHSLAVLGWGLGLKLPVMVCEGAGVGAAAVVFLVMTSARAAALGLTRRRMAAERLLALAVLVPALIALCARWS